MWGFKEDTEDVGGIEAMGETEDVEDMEGTKGTEDMEDSYGSEGTEDMEGVESTRTRPTQRTQMAWT